MKLNKLISLLEDVSKDQMPEIDMNEYKAFKSTVQDKGKFFLINKIELKRFSKNPSKLASFMKYLLKRIENNDELDIDEDTIESAKKRLRNTLNQ